MKLVQFQNGLNTIPEHNFLIFELLIIELCNLTCDYCYMRNESPSWGSFYGKDSIIKIIDRLSALNKPVSISLSGGEASKHPNFIFFIEYITSLINKTSILDLHINTNLSLSKEKINNILMINPNTVFHISYHSVDKTDTDGFVNKLKLIPEPNRELNIMIHPSKMEGPNIISTIEALILEEIPFYLKPVYINSKYKPTPWVTKLMDKYNSFVKKEYKAIYDNGTMEMYSDYDLLKNDLIPLQSYGCDCNYTFFTINCKKGDIKQMCRIFPIQNLFQDFNWFLNYDITKSIICPIQTGCLWASQLDHKKGFNVSTSYS